MKKNGPRYSKIPVGMPVYGSINAEHQEESPNVSINEEAREVLISEPINY